MGVRVFLAYICKWSNQRDSVAQLLLVLVVVTFQHGLPHLLSNALLQLTRRQHPVNHHVCMGEGQELSWQLTSLKLHFTLATHRKTLAQVRSMPVCSSSKATHQHMWFRSVLTCDLLDGVGPHVEQDGAVQDAGTQLKQAVQGQRGHVRFTPTLTAVFYILLELQPPEHIHTQKIRGTVHDSNQSSFSQLGYLSRSCYEL